MNTTKIKGTRKVEKGKLKAKFARLTNDDQLLDQSEVKSGKMQVNLVKIKENLQISQTSALWFNEWIVAGGEKKRIEVCQLEAKNKKYGQLNAPSFLF